MSLALQKGFSRASSWAGLERTFRHSFCASLTARATVRDHEDRESALQKTSTNSGLAITEGLHVSEVCNITDFFVTETTGKSCRTTRSSPKMPIFLPNEQASTFPSLKRTSFVWNKMPVIGDGPLQDVLQRREWPFMECRRRRFTAMQTNGATQLQIRNLILPWLQVVFQNWSEEETDVRRFGSLLFCLYRLRGSSHDKKKGYRYGVFFAARNESKLEKSPLARPETTANSRSVISILYLSRTWAGTDTRSKWRPSIVQMAHSWLSSYFWWPGSEKKKRWIGKKKTFKKLNWHENAGYKNEDMTEVQQGASRGPSMGLTQEPPSTDLTQVQTWGRERSWPAICDIWLGKRTIPVLAVAKESRGAAALAAIAIRASWGPIKDELWRNFLSGHLSVVCLDVFLPFSK